MSKLDLIVITGAGRGIGRAIALDLGPSKTKILCISKTENAKDTAASIVAAGGDAEGLIIDLEDYERAEVLASSWIADKQFNKIGLVLAAGIIGPQGPLVESSLKDWDLCFKVNLLGNLAIAKGFLPRMLLKRFGRIIGFAGGGAAYPYPLFPAYSATKTATVRLCENLAEDLKDKGDFAVVAMSPGAIDTDMLRRVIAAGAEVRSPGTMSQPVNFVHAFLFADSCQFSGSFVHARDNWQPYLISETKLLHEHFWKLRRME